MASFIQHFRTVSGLTLVSRIAGFARDVVLAHVLGATQNLFMSAYATGFMIPNLFRRLFGEGALSAAFIPVFTDYLERGDRKAAGRFMSVMIVLLVTTLAAVTLVAEGVFLVLRHFTAGAPKWHLIFGLAAVMFPFAITICLVALLQAALNCCRHFVAPALAPILLNLFIITGSVVAGLAYSGSPLVQVYVIAASILVAGIFQVAMQVPALVRAGLAFRPAWDLAHPGLRRVLKLLGPMVLGIGIVQIHIFIDQGLAFLLMSPGAEVSTFHLGGLEMRYPMALGAPAVLYYGARLYQFPLGVFSLALVTVIFPELSRYASRKDMVGLARVASHGLRLILFLAVPAGLGLILVAEPLTRLLFGHGRFLEDPAAVARTVWVTRLYALGIWSYSAQHMLLRAFYSLQDTRTPLRVAVAAAALNFVLNLILVWPMAEGGLALATVIAAAVQVTVLAYFLSRRFAHLQWRSIASSAARSLMASGAMAAATWAAMYGAAAVVPAGRMLSGLQVAAGVAAGVVAFAGVAWALRMSELRDLLRPPARDEASDAASDEPPETPAV